MPLETITDRVLYLPHQPETDRPLLAYLKGDNFALAIDAGNSAAHVDKFYAALAARGLPKPDFTAITHWHWDHTFGMHRIHGYSIAHRNTNAFLESERLKLSNPAYSDFLKSDDKNLAREYAGGREIVVVTADISFESELVLNLGGLTPRIFHVESPHSEDTVLVHLPEERLLFLGDATSEDYYHGGYMDQGKLLSLIDLIERIDCSICVLGHAAPLGKTELLDYLKLMKI